jgi:hypothetical protein
VVFEGTKPLIIPKRICESLSVHIRRALDNLVRPLVLEGVDAARSASARAGAVPLAAQENIVGAAPESPLVSESFNLARV